MNIAMVDVPRVYSMPMLYPYEHSTDTVVTYIHIGVGLCIARST